MKCPECLTENVEGNRACQECGFKFAAESEEEIEAYFEAYRRVLTEAYTKAKTPWEQSGKSGRYEDWVRLRIPVSECVERAGTFLDIGCANGFLLECLVGWTRAKGVEIVPYGLDYSEETLAMARERLPQFRDNLFFGNAWDWAAPMQFDYVRTETVYAPANLRNAYLKRLLAEFLAPGGKLLVAHYRSRREDLSQGWVDESLRENGFVVEGTRCGYSAEGLELCRVAVVAKGVGRNGTRMNAEDADKKNTTKAQRTQRTRRKKTVQKYSEQKAEKVVNCESLLDKYLRHSSSATPPESLRAGYASPGSH